MKRSLISAIRSIRKQGLFSLLNLIGISIGSASFFLIILFVQFEQRYEDFVPDIERIYRVALKQFNGDELALHTTENYPAVGPALIRELPAVEAYARLYNLGYKNNVIITHVPESGDPIKYKQRDFLYADPDLLDLMGYEVIYGEAKAALSEPFSAVLSEDMARLYFGDTNPIGKTLRMQDDDNNDELCSIMGVVRVPENSHLQFDVLFSYSTLYSRYEGARDRYDQSWERNDMYTYIRLTSGTRPRDIEEGFKRIQASFASKQEGRRDEIELQPVADIHLNSEIAEEQQVNGSHVTVEIMLIIAFFIAILACINYVNLSTASFMDRSRQVGVRKVLGADRFSLISQFIIEVGVMVAISTLLGLMLTVLSLPWLSDLTEIPFSLTHLLRWDFLMVVGLFLIGCITLTGIYPGFVLSNHRIVETLKGRIRHTNTGRLLRNGLIVFQFIIAIALLSGTFLVKDQIAYLLDQDIGLETDRVLIIERPGITPKDPDEKGNALQSFQNQLKSLRGVSNVTASLTIPGKKREYKSLFEVRDNPLNSPVTLRWNSMDYDFISTYGMKLLAGRNFSTDHASDPQNGAIITQQAAKVLGYDDPQEIIGKQIFIANSDFKRQVVGVVNDYHQESLKKSVDPIFFVCSTSWGEFYSIKLSSANYQETISNIERIWNDVFPGNPFDHFFLEDYFNRQYNNETRFLMLVTVFSAIILILTCVGLFGMSVYTVRQRLREMAIRKSIGATQSSIFVLMCKSYFVLIFFGVLLATPIVWAAIDQWLETFAYRTKLNLSYVVLSTIIVLVITLLSIGQQAWQLAKSNPVEALKIE